MINRVGGLGPSGILTPPKCTSTIKALQSLLDGIWGSLDPRGFSLAQDTEGNWPQLALRHWSRLPECGAEDSGLLFLKWSEYKGLLLLIPSP